MEVLKKRSLLCLCALLAFIPAAAQTAVTSVSAESAYRQALTSYRDGDWNSATLFLRRAMTDSSLSTADAWFMLVNSQMYAQDYRSALSDCETFLSRFSDSPLVPYVQYQKGRALHFTGRNDDAVIVLSDFCHQNPGHALYAAALYWIAECFFEDYGYDTARSLYERVVTEFPDDEKVSDAQFKLSLIAQREREEKLLYLLKMTGEESLSAREEYERQLRQYQNDDITSLRRELQTASQRIAELERELAETPVSTASDVSDNAEYAQPAETTVTREQTAAVQEETQSYSDSSDKNETQNTARTLSELKEKADLVERLLIQRLSEQQDGYGN